ncbi:Outer membrane efflux protein BepC [Roseobacter fucihabitans]|uniref:Outer membrane efflux protein BepC n=1 Tax=Roseobacter fucihabitans TaxID=1537242 RepID=A0ABZ2BR99_9RHOB|nr:TolC family outer membrane protein [Roseobacter litoralis]MBC6966647.1 Outer membrane efflux protein BepC precursor [Roseobacter litoralis]
MNRCLLKGLRALPTVALCASLTWGHQAGALSLEDSILFVLETNPEIKAAEANKQAIEFELDQARSFWAPRVEFEGRSEGSINNGTRTTDQGASDDALFGYEVSARITQRLYDGKSTRSEIERQAYRIDAAAYRVLERSEFLSLEAIRVYSDVIRTQALTEKARLNLAYHRDIMARIQSAYDNGVLGIADLQQAEERLFLAEDTLIQFELTDTDARILFLETVGVTPDNLQSVPEIGARLPGNLDDTLATAWRHNPTILFFQSDIGAAEALSRQANANRFPTLDLEAETRYGEDVRGFEGEVNDASIGLVLRYEIQGNRKRGQREEQIRRVSEQRARLLTQSRLVEREVRQSWSNLKSTQRRVGLLDRQATLSRDLLASYEREFDVGARSLIDVLNTQNALFQAEVNLMNARSLEVFVKYRLLAAAGILLPALGITPPEDSAAYAVNDQRAPGLNAPGDRSRDDAISFRDWRKSLRSE